MRAEQKIKERAEEPAKDLSQRPTTEGEKPRLTLEEQQAAGREAWRRLRELGLAGPQSDHSKSQEQERDRGPELDGPDLER
jgi:hypothetical protein